MSYLSIATVYDTCFAKYGATCKGIDCPVEEELDIRYSAMLKILATSSDLAPSVLDFGCGYGGLLKYISDRNIGIRYHGLEIGKAYYSHCVATYPDTPFYLCDILVENFDTRFDFVIMNGVLTAKYDLSYDEMLQYSKKLIGKCYDLSNVGLAVNFTSPYADKKRDKLFCPSLSDVGDIAAGLTRRFSINHTYLHFEQCLYLYK